MKALLVACAFASGAWAAPAEESWPSADTAHFVILREAPGAALGDYNRLERIYGDLHRELWTLVPWMEGEKVKVYLYKDRESFLSGLFKPPAWSGGLMRTAAAEKSLALIEPLDAGTAAHELSHLYLHSYFDGGKRAPPAWLDEGLAGLLQASALSLPDPRDKGPVLPAPLPLKELVGSRPARDEAAAWVGLWYQQAHSVVRYLKRTYPDDRFAAFCAALKEGQVLDAALRSAYGLEGLPALEAAWLAWRPRRAAGLPPSLEDH